MNKDQELENYLSISPNKFGIYVFDIKSLKNLYKKELTLDNNENYLNHNELKKFLDKNIFKIEKLSGKFVENISIVFEDKKIFNLEIGIKKKNNNITVTKQYLENLLIEAKDLFRENYQEQEIIHMIINKYLFDDTSHQSFKENLKCDHLSLEIQFKSIPRNIIYDLNKILENYQIKVARYLDEIYVKNFFEKDMELSEMTYKILNGCNENEVIFVPKNTKKYGFFEKFFQLFS
tara:strand:- start:1830 stop:2531 length:702 start_codon:yes stop_codon:yes gene_type:complete